ncbi:hypothetical protein ACWDX9_63625, partial [Nonomuraea sp. NPDC003201]
GQGQHVDVSLLESAVSFAIWEAGTAALDLALRHLTKVGVRSLVSRPPTLEELFLRHYDRANVKGRHTEAGR